MNFNPLFVSICLCIAFNGSKAVEVNTSSGLVRGQTVRVLDQNVDQFLSIPFAEPPIGDLRFAKPKPLAKPLAGVIDGTKSKNVCMQPLSDPRQSEDCLFVNVWSQASHGNTSGLRPVMFFIHGGGFMLGSINEFYNGSALATHDVVVVSTNYRLGIFGFLYGGDESSPGNVGLYDQAMALQWVRDNIHLFGGDKNEITIFGESAGSVSVSSHVLSPVSKGLFKRGIMESGAMSFNKDRPPVVAAEALIEAKQLAKKVNCTDDKVWLTCLRKVSAEDVVNNYRLATEVQLPVTGTEFLPLSAVEAFAQDQFNKDLDLILGVTKDEGTELLVFYAKELIEKNITKDDVREFLKKWDALLHNLDVEGVIKFYFGDIDANDSEALLSRSFDLFGDLIIKCPLYHFGKRYAQHSANSSRVFLYEITEGPEQFLWGETMPAELLKKMGIYHGAELFFVFGFPFITPNKTYSKREIDFSKQVMKLWTDFAKYGYQLKCMIGLTTNDLIIYNRNPGDNWRQFSTGIASTPYLVKDLNSKEPREYFTNLFDKTCDGFWKNYF